MACDCPVCGTVEQLLEFIHDHKDPRHGLSGCTHIIRHLGHARPLELLASPVDLVEKFLQNALSELLHGVDCQKPDMRQPVGIINLELRSVFKIHQVQADLIRRIVHHRADDHGM